MNVHVSPAAALTGRRFSTAPTTTTPRFAAVAGALLAAGKAIGAAEAAVDAIDLPKPTPIQVRGGTSPGFNLIRDGKPVLDMPASDWFYQSREAIKTRRADATAKATTDAERASIVAEYDALLADYDRQDDAREKAIPKAFRSAERKAQAAHRAYNRAELALVKFQPRSAGEAASLLEFASQKGSGSPIDLTDDSLVPIMRNVAAFLRRAR